VINSINGSLASTEIYAIDWVQVNAKGELFSGDAKVNKNWFGYNADLLAVAPGTVVEVVSNVPDAVPGKAPDNLTIAEIAGSRIILDLGSNIYAEYDHMVPNSATVHVGDHVTTGQKLGLLGNSGNTDAPHLHFQLMDRPSSLDGSALPFVFDRMELEGRVPLSMAELDATVLSAPLRIEKQGAKELVKSMPLSRDVVSFK
jgi:murein DD-endopeptidase MepM/ murein hydrolase activator NlpD